MATLRTSVLTALATTALTLTLVTSGVGHAAISAVQTVFVVNPPKNPVPVAAQGTTAIQGTVAVSNTASNPVAVAVSNTASNPVAVAPQDSAPTHPFQTQLTMPIPPGSPCSGGVQTSFTIPAGQRLVIQTATSDVFPISNLSSPYGAVVAITTTVNNSTVSYPIPPSISDTSGLGGIELTGSLSNLYADAGTTVFVGVLSRQLCDIDHVNVGVSGYLVPAP